MVLDKDRSGRPPKVTAAIEHKIISTIKGGKRNERELIAAAIASKYDVLPTTILRVLNRNSFRSIKPTFKSILTKAMMKVRYEFALAHAY